ncbi:MAG: protein-S-isoprenylcysteine O-methyltransferase [Pseudomonadota bacterium]
MNRALQTLGVVVFVALMGLVISRWRINGLSSLGWVALAIAISLIRAPYSRRTQHNTITSKREVTRERILLMLVMLGGTFIPLLHLSTNLLHAANYTLPAWTFYAGIAMALPGLWLFYRSHADLGDNWSVTTELREGQTLVTNGVYARCRHPMYAALFLLFLPQVVFVQNWIAGPIGPVIYLVLYLIRVPYEEAMMRDAFGTEYDDYVRRTGRVWPRLSAASIAP